MAVVTAWWARAWPALLGGAVVLTVAAPAAVASYLHARHVVARHDPVMSPWLPLSVDGMLLAALVVMWVRRRRGQAVGPGPWAAFVFGIVVTVAANAAAVEVPSVEAYAVNLFPPVALAVALELVALVAGRTARTESDRTESDRTTGPADRTEVDRTPGPDPDQGTGPDRTPGPDLLTGDTDRTTGPAPDQARTAGPATDDELADRLREWWTDPDRTTPTRNAVMREYGIGTTRATKLLDRTAPADRTGEETAA